MIRIETPYGNFGRFEDVLHFMKDEKLENIQMTVKYNFSQIGFKSMIYTCQDIEKIIT